MSKPNETKPGTITPETKLILELTARETDAIMNYLIDTNAGVNIFFLLEKRIEEAKKRLSTDPETAK